MGAWFSRFATWASRIVGTYWAFVVAVALVITWATTGPVFGFSNTWQLVINTATTIVTFLMVFLLQYDQNRNATAIQVKLDELLRSDEGARTKLVDAEDLSDERLEELHEEFKRLRTARRRSRGRKPKRATTSNGRR